MKFLFLVTSDILNRGWSCWTQFWKRITQGPSQPRLVLYGSVVLEEKIYVWKFTKYNRCQVLAKAYMTFGQVR